MWVVALIVGCADPVPPPLPPPPPPAAPPEVDHEAELLAKGPPAPGPFTRAFAAVAAAEQVALVRCPVHGGGKVRLHWGTPRDELRVKGPLLTMEIDPAGEPPWDPVFDLTVSEDGWVPLLAPLGSTGGMVRAGPRTLKMTWPAATAGAPVICTAVEEVPVRVLKGRVTGSDARMGVFGCSDEPVEVGKDGTFVVDARVPCSAVINGVGVVGDRVRVEPGAEPLVVELTVRPDTLQREDRTWTAEGREAANAALARVEADLKASDALLDRLAQELASDPDAAKKVERWKYEQWEWRTLLEHARRDVAQGG